MKSNDLEKVVLAPTNPSVTDQRACSQIISGLFGTSAVLESEVIEPVLQGKRQQGGESYAILDEVDDALPYLEGK